MSATKKSLVGQADFAARFGARGVLFIGRVAFQGRYMVHQDGAALLVVCWKLMFALWIVAAALELVPLVGMFDYSSGEHHAIEAKCSELLNGGPADFVADRIAADQRTGYLSMARVNAQCPENYPAEFQALLRGLRSKGCRQAEDHVQVAQLRAKQHYPHATGGGYFGLVRTIAYNHHQDLCVDGKGIGGRKSALTVTGWSGILIDDNSPLPLDLLLAEERRDKIVEAMQALQAENHQWFEVVYLRYFEGLSTKEIAHELGLPWPQSARTIQIRQQRGLEFLHNQLAGYSS